MLHSTALELEIGAGTGTSDLEDSAVLNTANGQTVGLDRVVVGAGNGYVAGVVTSALATATSPEVLWTPTDAHIATVICAFHPKYSMRSESCRSGIILVR